MESAKYIRTGNNKIIVFPTTMMHSEFKHFNPISAGFIRFSTNKKGKPTCRCFGESFSLGLENAASDTDRTCIELGLDFND